MKLVVGGVYNGCFTSRPCFRPALDQLASHVRQVEADLKRTPGDEQLHYPPFGMFI